MQWAVADALFRLTGRNIGLDAGSWTTWWRANRDSFAVPAKEPKAPRWRPFFMTARESAVHESWKHFLDLDHRAVELSH